MSTGVCDIGSMNLVKYIIRNADGTLGFDFVRYARDVKVAIRYLDNINDVSNVPLPEYREAIKAKRRVGLGNMGLGSIHFMLGIAYGSPESLKLIRDIYKCKAESELVASAELGKEKGSFPLFNKDMYFRSDWWKGLDIDPVIKKFIEEYGYMRNSHRSMNAPNGNSSIYAGLVSGGIEPVFLDEYIRWSIVNEHERRLLKKQGLEFPNVLTGEWFETKHFKFAKRGEEEVLKGTFNGVDYEIDKNRGLTKATLIEDAGWAFAKKESTFAKYAELGVFKTTKDLSVQEHISTLKIVAHYTDMNNSKTTNVPGDYPFEDFKSLYMDAWKSKIKGITTYRAGTMTAVLEAKEEIIEYQHELEQAFAEAGDKVIPNVKKLPKEYVSKGYILRDSNKKKWYITLAFVSEKIQKPFAVFVHTNCKEGNEVTADFIDAMEKLLISKGIDKTLVEVQVNKYNGQPNTTKIGRIIGMALRHNISMLDIVDVLDKFDIQISSFMFHLKKLLSKFIQDNTKVSDVCPNCNHSAIVYQDGCKMCIDCGWSKC